MQSKRARCYDAEALPFAKRLRLNIGDLVARNEISGRRGLELIMDAEAAGALGLQDVHRTKAALGKTTNAARFVRNMYTKYSAWPKEYRADVRVRRQRGMLGTSWAPMSFWLPHELMRQLHHFGSAEVLASRSGLDHVSLRHMVSVDTKMGAEAIPLGFWQDGVPCNWDRTVTLEVFTLSLPGQAGKYRNVRLPITALFKHQIGEDTMEDICNVIQWSLRWLALGVHPHTRHDGTAWRTTEDRQRKALAGKDLPCKAVLAQIRGDWKMMKELFKLPRWDEASGCCFRCWVKPAEIATQVGLSAPWRTRRKTWSDVISCIWRSGAKVNPLFSAPYVSLDVIRIDWLHAADMGVAADFQAGTLWTLERKVPGPNRTQRIATLNEKLHEFYDRRGVQDRIRCLCERTIKREHKAPKLKMQGAMCRAMVPFTLEVAEEFCDMDDPLEQAVYWGMYHLSQCYKALSAKAVFGVDLLTRHAPQFAVFYCSLQRVRPDIWRVKPKLHAWLEAAAEGGTPTSVWCYRDEDFGGSCARTGRSRGHTATASGVSRSMLGKMGANPILRVV